MGRSKYINAFFLLLKIYLFLWKYLIRIEKCFFYLFITWIELRQLNYLFTIFSANYFRMTKVAEFILKWSINDYCLKFHAINTFVHNYLITVFNYRIIMCNYWIFYWCLYCSRWTIYLLDLCFLIGLLNFFHFKKRLFIFCIFLALINL